MFELMFLPLLACLILVGIHAYLGFHVIERGVIFVDLALAQMAALGGIVGLILHESVPLSPYWISLLFTLIGAGIFSNINFKQSKVSQEAFIGIVYVTTAALSILILSKTHVESEAIKEMLVGNILFVHPQTIFKIFFLYSAIGIFHFIFRKKFLELTAAYSQAHQKIEKLWDFLFYASFAIVVTSSVQVAGVLLVFSFLIIPSFVAMIFYETIRARLILGWSFGMAGSLLGIIASALLDLPTGATVVTALMLLLIPTLLVKR